jgi:DNA repair exonuclease SbcCD ATPase subunit
MSESNDHASDSGSDVNWPLDNSIERQNHDQVVFENVADQYVKGEDVTAFFTILEDVKVNVQGDHIGLLRVGCTNVKDCLTLAPVEYNPSATATSTRHGTATFPSASLPVTDDEFYQFCYVVQTNKFLGTSIPFQLNCSLDDIDLLSGLTSNVSSEKSRKTNTDGLISFADTDNDDIVVIHTKRMLTEEKLRQENRKLLSINRRLEQQNDECKTKLDLLEAKSNEYINTIQNDMQTLAISHKVTIDELSARTRLENKLRAEYDACRSLCSQYQAEALQFAERCRTLEDAHTQSNSESNQLRSQLAVTSQLSKDQATQLVDLERRLMQTNETLKAAGIRQMQLESQIRDQRLTTEKHQISLNAQLEAYAKQNAQQDNQLNALETANELLKEELSSLQGDNHCLSLLAKQEKELCKDLEEQLNNQSVQHRRENEQAHLELETLRTELAELKSNQQTCTGLKISLGEVEKRCVKHQKAELESKRQLTGYQRFVADLQHEIEDLTERLSAGAEEYKILFRKHAALEQRLIEMASRGKPITTPTTTLSSETGLNEEALVTLLRNSYELQQQDQQIKTDEDDEDENDDEEEDQGEAEKKTAATTTNSVPPSVMTTSGEITECPMCYWEFPKHLTLDEKKEHIDHHFT